MPSSFRWGLIGVGRIGKAYVESLALFPGLELAWSVDPAIPEAPPFPDVLNTSPVGAALVCSPPDTHFPICSELLSRRIPVLCEKPVALTAAPARQLAGLAAANNTRFSQPAKFRGVPEVQEALSRIAAGEIGELRSIQVTFAAPVNMAGRWNADPVIAGGGVLMDNGTHAVDLIRLFAGPVAQVKAIPHAPVQNLPVEDAVTLDAHTRSGVAATVYLSWSHPAPGPHYLTLTGSQGEIAIGWQTSHCNGVPFGGPYQKLYSLGIQLQRFRDADPFLSPDDAVANVAAIEAAYRSIASATWEPVS